MSPLIRKLEIALTSIPIIFVGNDSLALFDAPNSDKQIEIRGIKDNPLQMYFGQPCRFIVDDDEVRYFRIGHYRGPLWTVSVTGGCVVFCAYTTDENGDIKSSGVYHAMNDPPSNSFRNKLNHLVDNVRGESGGPVTVKAAGNNYGHKEAGFRWPRDAEEYFREYREMVGEVLADSGVVVKPSQFVLGGARRYRITSFHPLSGALHSLNQTNYWFNYEDPLETYTETII